MRGKTRFRAFTHQGIRKDNQDYYLAIDSESAPFKSQGELFMVADGMGGHQAGALAAKTISQYLNNFFYGVRKNNPGPDQTGKSVESDENQNRVCDDIDNCVTFDWENAESVKKALESIFTKINMRLKNKGEEDPGHWGWGSTLSALVVRDRNYYFAHAGDTRIFRFRNGGLELLTQDQNMAFQMYKAGHVSYEQYLMGPGHNLLLSYMGMGKEFSVISGHGDIRSGDIFLLCSDGLNQFAEIRDLEVLFETADHDTNDLFGDIYRILVEETIEPYSSRDNVTFLLTEIR